MPYGIEQVLPSRVDLEQAQARGLNVKADYDTAYNQGGGAEADLAGKREETAGRAALRESQILKNDETRRALQLQELMRKSYAEWDGQNAPAPAPQAPAPQAPAAQPTAPAAAQNTTGAAPGESANAPAPQGAPAPAAGPQGTPPQAPPQMPPERRVPQTDAEFADALINGTTGIKHFSKFSDPSMDSLYATMRKNGVPVADALAQIDGIRKTRETLLKDMTDQRAKQAATAKDETATEKERVNLRANYAQQSLDLLDQAAKLDKAGDTKGAVAARFEAQNMAMAANASSMAHLQMLAKGSAANERKTVPELPDYTFNQRGEYFDANGNKVTDPAKLANLIDARKRAGAMQVQVGARETAFNKDLGQFEVKNLGEATDSNKAVRQSLQTYGNIYKVLDANPNIIAGPHEKIAEVQKFALRAFGNGKEDAGTLARTALIEQWRAQVGLAQSGQLKGSVSDFEQKLLARASSGDSNLTPQELKAVTALALWRGRQQIETNNSLIMDVADRSKDPSVKSFAKPVPSTGVKAIDEAKTPDEVVDIALGRKRAAPTAPVAPKPVADQHKFFVN